MIADLQLSKGRDYIMEERKAELSPWWRYGILVMFIIVIGVLAWITSAVYKPGVGAPVPGRVVDEKGEIVFTGTDITAGQQVFQKYGLMEYGSIWGHGAYTGPDFSAEYLHRLALATPNPSVLKTNRYDPETNTLLFTVPEANSYMEQLSYWENYLSTTGPKKGLSQKTLENKEELRQLVSFFAWAAWASVARIPGKDVSYTMNFPYEPLTDNTPSDATILWSALSPLALLIGIGIVLLAFGRYDFLGWHRNAAENYKKFLAERPSPAQLSIVKFFAVVSLLLLAQVLVGGAMAHYRTGTGSFFGFDLASLLPGTILRTWHLQTAIFWIVTAYAGGGLYLAMSLGSSGSSRRTIGINILWIAIIIVAAASMLGEFASIKHLTGRLWFWIGLQGWEYLELGRLWQYLFIIGLAFWIFLLLQALAPAKRDPERREISRLFLFTAIAIPVFYIPAIVFGSGEKLTIVDTWRFWIVHLWVEAFLELFVTVLVATMFFLLNMVRRETAVRVIYLDALLFLGSGFIGTGHHWYWNGQTVSSMALSSVFSAMELVPLILLTLEAARFIGLTESNRKKDTVQLPHRWTFYFLIAVGVWNFIGAGLFGFLVNLPVVNFFETGTNLTANHAHGGLMGVFGMLAVALTVFVLREVSDDTNWSKISRYIKVSFWGLNIGLAGMIILNLFPSGVLQLIDVVRNGYWHARSTAFSEQPLIQSLEWARFPADMIFIIFGVLPLVLAVFTTWLNILLSRKENKA